MGDEIRFFAGEVKYITASVVPRNPREIVVVTDAKYELINARTNEAAESGSCSVSGSEISALLGISEVGIYSLKLTVKVGAETFIQKASVYVEE